MSEEQLAAMLRFFKALADASRLRLIGALADDECSVEELAARLRLTPPTVSHHLAKLKEAGLVRMRRDGTTHLYRLDADALRTLSKDVLEPARLADLAEEEAGGNTWERKVLRDFLDGERLKEIPAARKKRYVVLRWLAERFEEGRHYPEREVNEILRRHHPDVATLRRELVSELYGFMQRDGGVYWRLPAADRPAPAHY